jgi:hypothetical protein
MMWEGNVAILKILPQYSPGESGDSHGNPEFTVCWVVAPYSVKGKKRSLCLTKHRAMKAYWGVEVYEGVSKSFRNGSIKKYTLTLALLVEKQQKGLWRQNSLD